MKRILVLFFCFLTWATYGQSAYKEIYNFGNNVSDLEITDSGIYISTHDEVFFSENTSSWTSLFNIKDLNDTVNIYSIKFLQDTLYLCTSAGIVIRKAPHFDVLFPNDYSKMTYTLSPFKNSILFYGPSFYSAPAYQLNKDRSLNILGEAIRFERSLSCDDSIIFSGHSKYGGYGAGFIYNSYSNSWSPLPLLENENVYESFVKNGQLIACIGKAYKTIFISYDYGNTGVKRNFPFYTGVLDKTIQTYNGEIYIASSKGIYFSKDTAQSWTSLNGFNVTDMVIKDHFLYGITSAGLLFQYDLDKVSLVNEVTGTVFLDNNKNGVQDLGEEGIQGLLVKLEPEELYASTNSEGRFVFKAQEGAHTLKWIPRRYHNLTTDRSSFPVNLPTSIHYNFGIYIDLVEDASIDLFSGPARPGFDMHYSVQYKNEGTIVNSETVWMDYDSSLTFLHSTPPPFRHIGKRLEWKIGGLLNSYIRPTFNVPASTPLSSAIKSIAGIDPSFSEINPLNNYDTLSQIVTGSYDPNDKLVKEGISVHNYVVFNTPLNYTIRFQNTGTDTAFVVKVIDTLDINHNIESLEIMSNSHPMDYTIKNRAISFVFNNILLPDSTTDEKNSHGFIKYKIRAKNNLPENTF